MSTLADRVREANTMLANERKELEHHLALDITARVRDFEARTGLVVTGLAASIMAHYSGGRRSSDIDTAMLANLRVTANLDPAP